MNSGTSVSIEKRSKLEPVSIPLPSSKSESNRALIINSFANGNLFNLSEARDTDIMQGLLGSESKELNVRDAGTTMRFLVAYMALTNQNKILTGTPRMCERPIGILVDALREIGAKIEYLENDGFPPLETVGFNSQATSEISIRGDVSSQYISAIMMMAPMLPQGLAITLTGKIGSKPYILMTLELMKEFGASVSMPAENKIQVDPAAYKSGSFHVESDWSGASYWFGIVALAEEATIKLEGLKAESLQGDSKIVETADMLGVHTEFVDGGLQLTKKESQSHITYDFSNCPDLAQTVIVVCAAKGIKAEFTGLESLKIKETDRILALQNELAKIGASLVEENGNKWIVHPATKLDLVQPILFETYEDHRMAMAFAPLATLMNITIDDPSAVNKSYPSFWNHMQQAGFNLTFND